MSRAEGFVCEQCRETIDPNADVCPHCSYAPGESHRKAGGRRAIVAGLLIISIVGSPLGVWLLWKARKHDKKAEDASPAVPV